MLDEKMLSYIGMAVVIVFAIYYVYKVMQVQNNVIEGLRNKKRGHPSSMDLLFNEDNHLKNANEKAGDTLLIGKYKNKYEDLLIELDTAIDNNLLVMLTMIGSGVTKDGQINIDSEGISLEYLQSINELYKLKENLNITMDFLDGTKASSSGTSSKSKGGFF